MVVTIKKILLTLILITYLFEGAMAEELTTSDRLDIIDVMSSYAKGIDTKDFDFYEKIFSEDGNLLISFEDGIAKVRTDIQATHYYKEGADKKSTLWGHYMTHMKKIDGSWKVVKHTLTSIGSD